MVALLRFTFVSLSIIARCVNSQASTTAIASTSSDEDMFGSGDTTTGGQSSEFSTSISETSVSSVSSESTTSETGVQSTEFSTSIAKTSVSSVSSESTTSETGNSPSPSPGTSTGMEVISSTAVVNGTDGNSSTTTVTSSAIIVTTQILNPCLSDPCPDFSSCITTENSYTCKCNEGYADNGNNDCVLASCKPQEFDVSNLEVNQDVTTSNCQNNLTSYVPNNITISVTFEERPVGTTVTANVSCNATCDNNTPEAIGYATCQEDGTYSTPQWIDCSVTDPTTQQQLTSAVVATSDPGAITSETVTSTVDVLSDVAAQPNVTEQTADEFMTVTNNLLRATDPDAVNQLQSSSTMITDSLYSMSTVVDVSDSGDPTYSQYQSLQSDIALGVAQPVAASSASLVAPKAGVKALQTFYYAFDGSIGPNSNLAITGISLSTSVLATSTPYVSAQSGTNRISFVVYTNITQLFPNSENIEILSNNIVFGVSGPTNINYTMQFPITSNITVSNTKNEFNNTKRLNCVKWGSGGWSDGGNCNSYSAHDSLASCICVGPGDYTMRWITIPSNDELSPGAIAGIVIGSLAGVAIIAGLVYYFMFGKKKSGTSMSDTNSAINEL